MNYFYKKLYFRSLTEVLNAHLEYLKLNAIQKLNLLFTKGKERNGKHLRKNKEKKILQERDGVLEKRVENGRAK